MGHLSTLRILNFIMAGIHALAIFLTIGIGVAVAVFAVPLIEADPAFNQPGGPPHELLSGIFLVVFLLVGVILLAEGILFVVAGRAVAQGRGRILQTVLAILQLPSFPFGTAYGIYALWVCWSDGPSKQAFDRGGVAAVPPA